MRLSSLIGVRLALAAVAIGLASPVFAQEVRPPVVVEVTGGYAGFVDDSTIHHSLIGTSVRLPISRRLSVGPEVVYMVGPGDDRDLVVTGVLTIDLVAPAPGRAARVVPYIAVGGGLFRHSDRFNGAAFSSTEGAFTAGGGVRVAVTPRVFVGADARIGWEPHTRIAGVLGFAIPSR